MIHGGEMDVQQIEGLSKRLERLEQRAGWYQRIAGIALAGMAMLSLAWISTTSTSAQTRILEAERLILRDAGGTVRAELRVGTQGETVFNLHDDRGRVAIAMGAITGFAAMDVGSDGLQQLSLRVGRDHLGTEQGARLEVRTSAGDVVWAAP